MTQPHADHTGMSRTTWLLLCGSMVVTLSLGIRHTFGLFLPPMSQEMHWGREVFSFAIAIQNLMWGLAQPFSGWLADRFGAGRTVLAGGVLYLAGLLLMTVSTTPWQFALSAGVLIGLGLSGTTFSVVYGALGRTVDPARQAAAMATVGAAGSFGQFFMVPLTQQFLNGMGWLNSLLAFALLVSLMVPMSWGIAEQRRPGHKTISLAETGVALKEAFGNRSYLLLTAGFFVCGFQVVFIGAHLPSYLLDKGFSANLGMLALALIGLFNVLGSWGFGKLGGKYSRKRLLAGMYLSRSVVIGLFLLAPLSQVSVILFSCAIGFLWLGTVPLTNGLVARIFGVRFLAMLSGFVFLSHQLGSFLGVWLGGWLFDKTGSYNLVWAICMALGVAAWFINMPIREEPLERPAAAAA